MNPRLLALVAPIASMHTALFAMSSTPTLPSAGKSPTLDSTPVPKSYAKGIAMTPDPWEVCLGLEYGGDHSHAWSVLQQVTHTSPAGWIKLEERILTALAAPECTAAASAFFCEMLALVGSAKSVPSLAALLRQPKTSEAARYALEGIPGSEADAALRAAAAELTGDVKTGVLGSIAARQQALGSAPKSSPR